MLESYEIVDCLMFDYYLFNIKQNFAFGGFWD